MGVLFFLLLMLGSGVAQAQIASPQLSPPNVVHPMDVPNGGPPQVVGYSFANTPESETIIGDLTLARTGASQYTATVHSVNGITAGNVAHLNVGTGLVAGAGSTLDLIIPVPISSGGLGGTTAPLADQILIAQSPTVYAPMPVGGDITIATNGVVTVHRVNGATPGGTCGANQFVDQISSSGVPTCTTPAITGIPPGTSPQIVAYSGTNTVESATVSGGPGGCGFTRTGANAYQMNCTTYAPLDSPTFVGTVSMPDGGRWAASGIAATTLTLSGAATATSFSAPQIFVNSGTGFFGAAAGAMYQQPGYTGAAPNNAIWNQAGISNMQAIGIGQPVGGDPLGITRNQNMATIVAITNTDPGTASQAVFVAHNGTYTARFGMNGTGAIPFGNFGTVASDQGLVYSTQNGLPHNFMVNSQFIGAFAANGLHLQNPLEVDSGGTATADVPSQNQILIAQGPTVYTPRTVSGDMTLASTGVATVGTSGVYQPDLYIGSIAACGVTYSGRGGYWYKVNKLVVVYFNLNLTSLGSCGNGPLYVSMPFTPTLNGGISMDLIQVAPLINSTDVPTGSVIIAQGNGQAIGSGAVALGALVNGNAYQMRSQNLQPNSSIRGRAVFLID